VLGFAETTSAILVAGMPELGQVSDKIAAALISGQFSSNSQGRWRGHRGA
jgi:transposase